MTREPGGRLAAGLPAGAVSTWSVRPLDEGWEVARADPVAEGGPDGPAPPESGWSDAPVPGTVAAAVGPDGLDGHPDYDASDWWYRLRFPRPDHDGPVRLRFDGLATLAEGWLNGSPVLESENMFLAHRVPVEGLLEDENELLLRFRSTTAALAGRRPRPRWKTALVPEQKLRWIRTTLFGRIPGWTPAIAPVGPWRPVWIETGRGPELEALSLRPSVDGGVAAVRLSARFAANPGSGGATATLSVAGARLDMSVEAEDDHLVVRGGGPVPDASPWMPHTHGEPALHDCTLELTVGGETVVVDCGRIGFREVTVDREDGAVRVRVGGLPVFCRGACWTPLDPVTLAGDDGALRSALRRAVEAGANMLRVGGTMVYEDDRFYALCDELGILVWQDFMFANMDYPVDDPDFRATAEAEAAWQLRRLQRHPSVVVWCGGSEIEQQAAMFGADPETWRNDFFGETLPALVAEHHPGTPYWPSTPTGGALPFHVGEELAHYYGVGAYLRPLDDARLAGVRFTPECLGFSNVPGPAALARLTPHGAVPPHHPAWKAGVPRDSGAGWDFEDVRDHYLAEVFGEDPVALRSTDLERYLELSRVVTGHLMERVFAEWRGGGGPCGGALVWFFRDLRPGAGWGVLDDAGRPKPVFHHLRRAWAPRTVRLLDRGLDGLLAAVVNERPEAFEGRLEIVLVARGSAVTARADGPVTVDPWGVARLGVDALLGRFHDTTWAYRFGPPSHEAVVATLYGPGGEPVARDLHRTRPGRESPATGVEAAFTRVGGAPAVELTSGSMAYDVRIDVRDHEPEDDYFGLVPGETRVVRLRPDGGDGRLRGFVEATNLADAVRIADDPGG